MANDYTMNWTDSVAKAPFTVSPLNFDNVTSSLTLYGQGYLGYGEGLQENLIQMLENFSSGTAPLNPTVGQFWYDSVNQQMNVFANAQWNIIVDLTQAGQVTKGYVHLQGTNSSSWVVNHNLNTTYIQAAIFIENAPGSGIYIQMIPQEVLIVDADNVQVAFTTPLQGRVHLTGIV